MRLRAWLIVLTFLLPCLPAAAERPNIVLVLADDLGYGDVAAYNAESKIPTPHMDRLAREGMRFTDAHSGSAVCTPTRYGLLTGRHAWRTRLKKGVLGGFSPPLIDQEEITVAELLAETGYQTAIFGKWHLGLGFSLHEPASFGDGIDPAAPVARVDYSLPLSDGPRQHGFQRFFGISASLDMPPYIFLSDDRFVGVATATKKWLREGPAEPDFEAVDVVRRCTEETVRYISEQKDDAPFLICLTLTSPHTPIVPREEFHGRSEAGRYGDFVVETDWAVGQVMEALEKAGHSENTLLLVTSDNGATPGTRGDPDSVAAARNGHRSNAPWRGAKADIWEGGHRVPFLARWPQAVKPGTVCETPICLTSFMATAAELAGVKVPAGAAPDSFSFAGDLRSEARTTPAAAVVHHSINGMFAVRHGPWKFIDGAGSGGWTRGRDEHTTQLYNLEADPAEQKNLATERPRLAQQLKSLLQAIRKDGAAARKFALTTSAE